MSKNFNKWIFEGNLLRDPELRYTPRGHPVTTLMVACNNTYTNGDGQKVEELVVYKVAAWNALAEVATQYLKKGSHVLIEACPVADQSADTGRRGHPKIWAAQDGTARSDFECKILDLRMLNSKSSSEPGPAAAETAQESAGEYEGEGLS
jgi:single-strand DNA-binding protein